MEVLAGVAVIFGLAIAGLAAVLRTATSNDGESLLQLIRSILPLHHSEYDVVLSDVDRTLLARCLNGTDGAWEDFVDRYLALITHVVTSTAKLRLGEIPDNWRDDVVAEVLLGLVDQDFAVLRRFRGQSSLGTYLVVVARRITVRKLAKMRRAVAATQPILAELSDDAQDTLDLENQEEVQSLLANMPEQEATAIRMFHLENRSYSDIGHHFGIPENSVGPLLSRARDRIRNLRQDPAT